MIKQTKFNPTISREICDSCHEIIRVSFWVDNNIWKQATPYKWENKHLCINCFTRFADERLLDWDKTIRFYPISKLRLDKEFLKTIVKGK